MKKKLSLLTLTAPAFLMAKVETKDLLGGAATRTTLSSNIHNWLWIIPLIVLALAISGSLLFYKKQKDKALSQGQSEDDSNTFKIMAKTAGVGLGIVILIYVLLAGFGYAFLGLSGSETWNTFIINPFRLLLGLKAI